MPMMAITTSSSTRVNARAICLCAFTVMAALIARAAGIDFQLVALPGPAPHCTIWRNRASTEFAASLPVGPLRDWKITPNAFKTEASQSAHPSITTA